MVWFGVFIAPNLWRREMQDKCSGGIYGGIITDRFILQCSWQQIYKINSTNNGLLKRYGNSTLFTVIYMDICQREIERKIIHIFFRNKNGTMTVMHVFHFEYRVLENDSLCELESHYVQCRWLFVKTF